MDVKVSFFFLPEAFKVGTTHFKENEGTFS